MADSLTPRAAGATKADIFGRIITNLPRWIVAFLRSDFIFIQETLLLWPLVCIKNLGKRRRVVFDFSDPIDRHGSGLKGMLRRFAFKRMVQGANVTMVENKSYLRSLASKAQSMEHFYGPVNVDRYVAGLEEMKSSPRVRDRLRIGWTGSPGTYSFIAPLVPIIDSIAADVPIELVLIGVEAIPEPVANAHLTLLRWNENEEFRQIPTFDLALFRFEPTEDASWRGAGKLFIYMASGAPFLATDRGIAHDVMEESGVGFAVEDDTRWEIVLRSAITNQEERDGMSQASIDFADRRFSYDRYREKLLDLLGSAGDGR